MSIIDLVTNVIAGNIMIMYFIFKSYAYNILTKERVSNGGEIE